VQSKFGKEKENTKIIFGEDRKKEGGKRTEKPKTRRTHQTRGTEKVLARREYVKGIRGEEMNEKETLRINKTGARIVR